MKIKQQHFGDENTKYFHASLRKRKAIYKESGFMNNGPLLDDAGRLLLITPMSDEEINEATFSIPSAKALALIGTIHTAIRIHGKLWRKCVKRTSA